jgi:hypothetical protein
MKKTILCFIIGFISGGILLNQVTFQKITSSPMATLPDGGVYFGSLKDGKLNGQGEIQWSNNTLYRGMFLEGLFEGEGYLTFADDTAYTGEFKQGEMNGEGVFYIDADTVMEGTFVNSMMQGEGKSRNAFSQYMGSFSKGKYHGEGFLELSSGGSYSGAFNAGYYHGMGMFVDEIGNEYVGQFIDGLFTGEGIFTSVKGEIYRGGFENWLYQGKGYYKDLEGDQYIGQFVDGAFTGEGVFKSAQGDVYRGKFNEWSFQGKGDYEDSEGNRYIGEFVDGSFTGEGEYKAMDGSIYSGQFKNWSLHGKGKYRGLEGEYYEGEFKHWKYHGTGEYANHKGDVYIGGFKNGLYHGEGVMVYAAALDGVKTVDGSWNWGDLRTDKNRPELLSDPDFHETVLYNQSNLLEKSWDQLQDHDANKIDLYLLSIAGDGSQGVFRRESNSLQQYFNMQLNTDGKSMQLVNSRLTSEIIPLATKTSIRRSLNAIANKMDKQQDILFLYLTSHGSKEHELYLNNSQMKLNDLTAKDLASYLKAAEIKWKVVVVSSCYSGGYIDHLADENTLIITSSAADRTSFGCESNNDFTYFGRAFIEHGLPLSNSFPDAFRLATEQVTKQELAAELEPSQPKIHQPKAILNHLKKWRNSLN